MKTMPFYQDVGEVSVDGVDTIRWRIPGYTRLPKEEYDAWWSPWFTFRGQEGCFIHAYPNGFTFDKTEGWLEIVCHIGDLPERASLTCCMVARDGRETLHARLEKDGIGPCIQHKWIRRSELEARSEELLPGGQLHILVRVVFRNETERKAEEEKSAMKMDVSDVQESSSNGGHLQNSSEKDSKELSGISLSDTSMNINKAAKADVTNFRESNSNERHFQTSKGMKKLHENLKDLFVGSKHCDFIICVRGKEFPVHQCILKARIPAFDAMLSHNMTEKKEGVVTMEDCDPDVFHEFLLFVYFGCVENFSPENMCGLYVLADKYGLQDLKEMCLDFIKSSLSVQMICDIISLAAMHNEAELLKLATDFFVNNAEEILVSVKWQVFLAENPDQGNELFLKAVKFFKTK